MKYKFSVLSVLTAIILSGCNPQSEQQSIAPPPTAIDVASVAYEAVQRWHTYTTRLESPEVVTLMPRVSGVIHNISFNEGQQVNKGDVLFQIDPRPFQAEVARLKAEITSAEAALEQAQSKEQRAVNLGKRSAISEEQMESRVADTKQRQADLLALRAQLDAAKLDLTFTEVKSPIDGVISRADITRGNNVTANKSVLTTIIANEEMYAYFNIDERTWNSEFSEVTSNTPLPVTLSLTGNKQVKHHGFVDFVDNTINPSTGTLRVRASFSNEDAALKPGAFARLQLASSDISNKILIPDRAIGTDLKNRFVLTVSNDNVLEYKLVEVGERHGNFRVINKGLTLDDQIAVNGPAKVGPGMPVTPRRVTLDLSAVKLTIDESAATDTIAAR
ncbi:efflux RND transporter periplasmic adaptor subunit [Thalassotalea euphylliae]|uniref:efflux RND transporter periplasmic adaptor subunit n=1 Tax=Thalassotalea euphylliae TaxID=1655234 RepID=UPI00363BBFEE